MSAKLQNVPKLRFPEFSGAWEDLEFSDFLNPNFREVLTPNFNYLSIGIRSHGRGTFQKPDSDPAKIAMETLFLVKTDDLIVNITFAWEGAIAIAKPEDEGGYVSHRFPTYEFRRSLMVPNFFRFVIDQKRFRKQLELISPGGAGRNRVMSKPAFIKLAYPLPKPPEQKKIADFLGAVDAKLAALRESQKLLQDYKKGLMQKLFSQALRFTRDDGTAFPDWEERKLGEVASILKGKGISKSDIVVSGKTPCIRYGELYTDYGEVIANINSRTDAPKSELLFSLANDVIIPASGETHLDMARASCVLSSGVALGGDLNIIRSKIYGVFLAYYLSNAKKIEIATLAQGNSVVHLYGAQLKGLPISVPHPDEQRKIADALCALDAKIAAVSAQIDKMTLFKKGLLQQMFV